MVPNLVLPQTQTQAAAQAQNSSPPQILESVGISQQSNRNNERMRSIVVAA